MQGDHVGFVVEGFKWNIFRKICNIRVLVPVIREYAAAESRQFFYDGAPDLSGAYDPHCKILQFPADQSGERKIIDLRPPESLFVIAQAEQDHHYRIICYTMGIVARIAHMQPDPARVIDIDMVVANGSCRHAENPLFFHHIKFRFAVVAHTEDGDAAAGFQF